MVKSNNNQISIVMGSQSDWPCLKHASKTLKELKIDHEVKIISAHRTPDRLFEYAENAEKNGIRVIIAGAGGSAHLPGMISAKTPLPVLGVPMRSSNLNGIDSLLSIVQMPAGVPVGTLAIGNPGAINAALLSVQILALSDLIIANRFKSWRKKQTDSVIESPKDG